MAQEPGQTVELDPVTITASPLEETELEIARPASVLYGDELRRKVAPTIGETLAEEPGVSASEVAQGASRPVIRGLDAPRVRVLENGIGSMDVSNISADHAISIEPLGARQVEILRGPATLLYGSGAIGGVVNVVTNRILDYVPETLETEVDVRYGSVSEERTGRFDVTGGIGDNVALHLDAASRETNDYEIPDDAADDPETVASDDKLVNSAVDTDNFSGGGSYVGDRGFVGAAVGRYLSQYGIPGAEGVFIDADQTRYDAKGELQAPLPGFQRLKVDAGYNDYTHTEFEGPGEPGTVFENEEYEARLELLHHPLAKWSGAVGVQYRDQDFAAIGEEAFVAPTETRALGLFVVEEREFGPLTFELGSRYERQETDASGGNPDADHDLYSVSTGAIYNFSDNYALNISATRSQRAPAAQELYAAGPHLTTLTFEQGDAGLEEETAHSVDIGLRKTQGRLTWGVNAFANRIDDFIFLEGIDGNGDGLVDRVSEEGEFDPVGELVSVAYEQQDAEFYGGEVEGVIGLLQGSGSGLDLRVFADYVRGKLDGGGDLPRITPLRFGAGLDYTLERWSAGIDVIQIEEQDQVAELETETQGYTMLDANLTYWVASNADYQFFVQGSNLLDEEARRHTSFVKETAPLPGRSVLVGLNARF
ncbi:MAG: TonB-dependent receptor [Gammaproteobacteria bacterium]|nr:TonB-dependent receptor [Gammaproteobacteria bacterium]